MSQPRAKTIHDYVKPPQGSQHLSQHADASPGLASKTSPPSSFLTSNTVPAQNALNPKNQAPGRNLTTFSTSLGVQPSKQQTSYQPSVQSSTPQHASKSDDISLAVESAVKSSMSEVLGALKHIAKVIEGSKFDGSRSLGEEEQKSAQEASKARDAALKREIMDAVNLRLDIALTTITSRLDALETAMEGLRQSDTGGGSSGEHIEVEKRE